MIKKIYGYIVFFILIISSSLATAKQHTLTSNALDTPSTSLRTVVQTVTGLVLDQVTTKKLAVTATAYTSHRGQTDSTPNIAAWGDRLKSGMKVIAVSRDLLDHYQLKRGTIVKIHGLSGHYIVLDKMNRRWKKKIDIYMGMDKQKAFSWGKQNVVIEWLPTQ